MSAVDPLEQFLVTYGPEQLHGITVHDREDGSAVIEEVTSRPVRVFDKTDGLRELHGEAKDAALEAFWQDVEAYRELNNLNGGGTTDGPRDRHLE
ncbi:hypothetical protein [Streptomyces sp. NPDC003299]